MTDAEIVSRTRAGNTTAFGELVRRYRNAVHGVALHHLHNVEDAQDVAQEVFLKAYVRLEQLQDPKRFGPWLRRIAVNECRMKCRQRSPVAIDDPSLHCEDGTTRLAFRLSVQQALSCLSEDSRLTVTLFYMGGYSHSEIAAFLEVPTTTVKSRLRDARNRLRKELAEMVEDTLHQAQLSEEFTDQVVRHVLLLEDDRQLATMAHDTLVNSGLHVLAPEETDDIWATLERANPTVLILSRNTPGEDAISVVGQIKSSARFAKLPVLLVMSQPAKEDIHRAWEAGADCFLTKPYDPDELTNFVQRLQEQTCGKGAWDAR